MNGQIWAEIEGLEGYEVNLEGEVRCVKRVKMKSCVEVGGRKVYRFHVDGKIIQRNAKKLVETYHGITG
jgi:hypothetical protein